MLILWEKTTACILKHDQLNLRRRPSRVTLMPKGKYPILIISGMKNHIHLSVKQKVGFICPSIVVIHISKVVSSPVKTCMAGTLTHLCAFQVPQVRGLCQGKFFLTMGIMKSCKNMSLRVSVICSHDLILPSESAYILTWSIAVSLGTAWC